MIDNDKPQVDAAAEEELKGVPEEFLDDSEAGRRCEAAFGRSHCRSARTFAR